MPERRFYDKIVQALDSGLISEPFCCDDVERSCVGTEGFSESYIQDHVQGNDKGNPELFVEVEPGRYRCLRPSDYNAI